MKCPICGSRNNRVLESRETTDGAMRRRRICYSCGNVFRMFETAWIDAQHYRKGGKG